MKSGGEWREQRRFALHQLRNLGFGKTSMEDHISYEINHLSEVIDKTIGQEINFRTLFPISVSNNINSLIFGRRFDYNDKRKQLIDEFLKPDPNINLVGVFSFFPVLSRYVFKYLYFLLPSSLHRIKQLVQQLTTLIRYLLLQNIFNSKILKPFIAYKYNLETNTRLTRKLSIRIMSAIISIRLLMNLKNIKLRQTLHLIVIYY